MNILNSINEKNYNHKFSINDLIITLTKIVTAEINNIEQLFDKVAVALLQQTKIVTPFNHYYLREIEFYVYDKIHHPDVYVHKNKRQLQFGQWYFHRYKNIDSYLNFSRNGLDITFGNEDKGIYGGILIRTIEHTISGELTSGIHRVAKVLIEDIGKEHAAYLAKANDYFVFDQKQAMHLEVVNTFFHKPVYKTKRHGLTYKNEENTNYFYEAPYCYFNHNLPVLNKTEVRSALQ